MDKDLRLQVAQRTVGEAKLVGNTGADLEEVMASVEVAHKALNDQEITDDDLNGLHPSIAAELRERFGLGSGPSGGR